MLGNTLRETNWPVLEQLKDSDLELIRPLKLRVTGYPRSAVWLAVVDIPDTSVTWSATSASKQGAIDALAQQLELTFLGLETIVPEVRDQTEKLLMADLEKLLRRKAPADPIATAISKGVQKVTGWWVNQDSIKRVVADVREELSTAGFDIVPHGDHVKAEKARTQQTGAIVGIRDALLAEVNELNTLLKQ